MENNKELLGSIFNSNTGAMDTLDYLENIAREHPYFVPAQFYLLLETKKDHPAYSKHVQKTAALFNNNYWLNYLLATSSKPEPIFVQPAFETAETIADIKPAFPSENEIDPEVNKVDETSPIGSLVTNEAIENKINNYESVVEKPIAEEVELLEPVTITEEAVQNNDNNYSGTSKEDLSQAVEASIIDDDVVPFQPVTMPEEVPYIDENISLENDGLATIADEVPTNNFTIEAIDENIDKPVTVPANKTEEAASVMPEKEITTAEELANRAIVTNNIHDKKSTDADTPSETLLFQPLYTSDYFASVGIKLSEEANGSDRLGKQLKSFTQWLKTMKKIDPGNTGPLLPSEMASENVDHNIKTLAEKSNKDEDIITEAMADVLVQQGRINKAVEVLKKLSLLNPSKSTYFAAKIEQLKD